VKKIINNMSDFPDVWNEKARCKDAFWEWVASLKVTNTPRGDFIQATIDSIKKWNKYNKTDLISEKTLNEYNRNLLDLAGSYVADEIYETLASQYLRTTYEPLWHQDENGGLRPIFPVKEQAPNGHGNLIGLFVFRHPISKKRHRHGMQYNYGILSHRVSHNHKKDSEYDKHGYYVILIPEHIKGDSINEYIWDCFHRFEDVDHAC